jgi:hypothetical protein
MINLWWRAAVSSSMRHSSETADSGVSTKIRAFAPTIPFSMRDFQSAAGSMARRSSQTSLPRAVNASCRRLTNSMSGGILR